TNWSIHTDRIAPTPAVAPADALALFGSTRDHATRITAIRHLMLALGDISTNEAGRRIDAGYTAGNPGILPPDLRTRLIPALTAAFNPEDPGNPLQYEIARLLGMLHADTSESVEALAATFSSSSHPTHDAHYLFCLAQMPGPREKARTRIVEGFLGIDRKLDRRKLLTDRNWSINLRDALRAHLELDPHTGPTLARSHQISPYNAYLLTLLPTEEQRVAARKMKNSEKGWDPDAISFVEKHLPAADVPLLLGTFRSAWKREPRLRPHLTGYFSRHGTETDKKLAKEFYQPPASQIDLTPFAEKMKEVNWSGGEPGRGQAVYARYNCATCHSGNRRLGPSLQNIAKRFNREDLFRHINEPNLALSDLYKATQITTADGVYIGMKVYSSEAQTIL
ncbi:MAG: hypothetical protein QGG01_03850, partial [Roseibacillus sp.]|nr:hypothetical protein [Roseibacillus sp.]